MSTYSIKNRDKYAFDQVCLSINERGRESDRARIISSGLRKNSV